MKRVKIKYKHNANDREAKQKLLEILSPRNINICNLFHTKDGNLVAVTATDADADKLLQGTTVADLQSKGFDPILPPEVRSRRTVICHKIDGLIFDKSPQDI